MTVNVTELYLIDLQHKGVISCLFFDWLSSFVTNYRPGRQRPISITFPGHKNPAFRPWWGFPT